MTKEAVAELREAAYDYAHLIQAEGFDRNDMAVHRAYERLRKALGEPLGLPIGKRNAGQMLAGLCRALED